MRARIAWYAVFALIALGTNLGIQWIVTAGVRMGTPSSADSVPSFRGLDAVIVLGKSALYWIALAAGTAGGFLLKYALDKKFVFRFRAASPGRGAITLVRYGLTAVVTTVVFWSVQWLFAVGFSWEGAKYVGGSVGLTAGYILKYFLDRRFVFKPILVPRRL